MKRDVTKITICFFVVPVLFGSDYPRTQERNSREVSQRTFNEDKTAKLQWFASRTNHGSWPLDRVKVMCLTSEQADPNVADETFFYSFLHWASFYNDIEVSKCLLKHGANVNIKNWEEETPLFSASSVDMVQLLVDHKADVHHRGRDGKNPLHRAAVGVSAPTLLAKFCDVGVDATRADNFGDTPLHKLFLTSASVNENILRKAFILLVAGGNIHVENVKGETPLHLLIAGHPALVDSVSKLHKNLQLKSPQERKLLLGDLVVKGNQVEIDLNGSVQFPSKKSKKRCVIL